MITNNEDNKVKKAKKQESSDKFSGGINLALGSDEYNEYIMDHKGIDEFQQDDIKLANANMRTPEVVSEIDEDHAERQKFIEDERAILLGEKQEDLNYFNDNYVKRRGIKRRNVKNILKKGKERALLTETLEDDLFVEHNLPGILETDLHCEENTLEDFYYGDSLLDKYL